MNPTSPGTFAGSIPVSSPCGRRTLAVASLYSVALLVALVLIRRTAFGWWPTALLVFMPRSLLLLPIVPMIPPAIRSRRPSLAFVVLLDAWIVIGPIMGFAVPWRTLTAPAAEGPRIRIMTFNQASRRYDVEGLLRYVEGHEIDVVCFQEPAPPPSLASTFGAGWHFDRHLRIASRHPIVRDFGRSAEVNKSNERYSVVLYRALIRHPDGFDFVVGSVHMPTPRRAYERLRAGDWDGVRSQLAWWDEEAARLFAVIGDAGRLPLLVGGDFNMPADYRTMAATGSILPSAFDVAGWGYGFTRPTRFPWVRIDHVIGSRQWAFARSWVGPDFGSDHLPLIAEAVLVKGRAGQ